MNKKLIITIAIVIVSIIVIAAAVIAVLFTMTPIASSIKRGVIKGDDINGIVTITGANGEGNEVIIHLNEGIQTIQYDITGRVDIKILNEGKSIYSDTYTKKSSNTIRIPHSGEYVLRIDAIDANGTIKYTPSTGKTSTNETNETNEINKTNVVNDVNTNEVVDDLKKDNKINENETN